MLGATASSRAESGAWLQLTLCHEPRQRRGIPGCRRVVRQRPWGKNRGTVDKGLARDITDTHLGGTDQSNTLHRHVFGCMCMYVSPELWPTGEQKIYTHELCPN